MKDEIKEIIEILDNVIKCCDITKDQSFTVYQRQDILKLYDYITNLQEKYDKALEDSDKQTHKLMAIRKYLKSNEREYGALEDNEKIILGIIECDDNE